MPLKLNRTLYTVNADLNTKASVDSPALEGTPTAPTPSVGDNSTKLATTGFVAAAAGNLLRITTFESSGTWTKQADVSKVLVYCVGGGGGGGGSTGGGTGGSSSFGAFCSASGGIGGLVYANQSNFAFREGSAGGSTGVGDIILIGQRGAGSCYTISLPFISPASIGGSSAVSGYGSGARGNVTNASTPCGSGGGGGATAIKLLLSSSLTATVSVTIGAGGSAGTLAVAGTQGIVFIYEYGY